MATIAKRNILTPTLPGLIAESLHEPRARCIGERRHHEWHWLSSGALLERSEAVACALRDAGAKPGDRVALISENCVDWIVADFGTLLAGCVVVPIFATIADDQLAFILADAQVVVAFAQTEALAARVRSAYPGVRTVVFASESGSDGLAAFEAAGERARALERGRVASFTAGVTADDLAVLIYTSGTTGDPKGVMLTHANVASNALDAGDWSLSSLERGGPVLSVLPFSHIYEHTMILCGLARQFEFAITTPEFLLRDLLDVRPRFMTLVPRICERVLAGIVAKARAHGGLQAQLVPWALRVGHDHARVVAQGARGSVWLRLQYQLARRLVLRKIRPALGLDRLAFFTSGSAKLHRDITFTFAGCGIPITEGYGLTETSPVICVNRIEDNRIGTVGRPIPHVEVRIAGDGEILARGPNVMKGYYHRDDAPIDADGWFATGDIGELDADGFLTVTDRKNEVFKTTNGKYVAPSRVEASLKRSPYISQALVSGSERPFPVALIVPNWELVRRELALQHEPPEHLVNREDVNELLRGEAVEQTRDLAPFEQIRRVALLPHEFTIEAGELSPALKVKRRVVARRYAAAIDSAYALSDRFAAAN